MFHSRPGRLPFSSHSLPVRQAGTALSTANVPEGTGWGGREKSMARRNLPNAPH